MTDSSYEEDDHSQHDEAQHPQHSQHVHHTHSHSAFTQRFGAIKKQFPSAFKKNMARERMTSNEEEHPFGHEKAASFGSMFKNRFQPAFVNRIRSPSDPMNNGTASNPSPSPGHYSLNSSSISPKSLQREHAHERERQRRNSINSASKKKRQQKKRQKKKKKHHSHSHSHSHGIMNRRREEEAAVAEEEDEEEVMRDSKEEAFAVLLNENRALKNEIEVYKRSLDALSVEKEHLESNYDELKSKVSDVTTQLRIMTKRYNKLKNKNEEYKKHFQNTLTIRLSAQQQTITNYHAQLTQIKEKYDILYSEYLDKNNIIKDWETKYHRLAADFDEFMQGHTHSHSHQSHGHVPHTPSQLVAHSKQLKRIIIEKDQSLHFLSQIISNMYHNALPIIENHAETVHDDADENEDHKTESTDSNSSHDDTIHEEEEEEDEEEEEVDEEDEEDEEEDELSGLEEEIPIYNMKHNENESQNEKKAVHVPVASRLSKLQIPSTNKLNDRSLSGISVDDDGIDKHDDNEILAPKSAGVSLSSMNPIELPQLRAKVQNKIESKTPTVISMSSSHSVPIKKKRRRSWVMEGGNGPIIITTMDGKHRVSSQQMQSHITQQNNTKSAKSKKQESPSKSIASSSSSSSASASASSSTDTTHSNSVDVAPSPAPPPPNPYVLQPQQSQQQQQQQQESDDHDNDISNNISDQLSTSSHSPAATNNSLNHSSHKRMADTKQKKITSAAYSNDDDDDDDDDGDHVGNADADADEQHEV